MRKALERRQPDVGRGEEPQLAVDDHGLLGLVPRDARLHDALQRADPSNPLENVLDAGADPISGTRRASEWFRYT